MKMNKTREILIDVKDLDDVYNTFNPNDISEDLQYYIEDQCNRIGSGDIVFKVVTDEELTYHEKDRLVDTIRRHYGLDVKHNENSAKRNLKANLLYFIAGVLFIIVLSFVKNIGFVLPEVLDIIGWVIIWESIYNLLFKDAEMDVEVVMAKRIYESKIVFKKRS